VEEAYPKVSNFSNWTVIGALKLHNPVEDWMNPGQDGIPSIEASQLDLLLYYPCVQSRVGYSRPFLGIVGKEGGKITWSPEEEDKRTQ